MTGCPTVAYELHEDNMRKIIKSGHFWQLLSYYKSQNYLVAFETDTYGRWATISEVQEQDRKLKVEKEFSKSPM